MKRSPKRNAEDDFKELMKLDVSGEETDFGDLPDVIDIYEKLAMDGNIDDELEKAHVAYSFCSLLAEEFQFQARKEEAELTKWSGEKWRKLKSSSRRKYTDQDAKRTIESKQHYCDAKIRIAKLEKLYRQLAFSGAKSIDMGAQNLKYRVSMALRMIGDFNIKKDRLDDKVKSKINSRLRRKEKGD